MKIAVAGKGGTGKTTISTLLVTYLASNAKVLAIDSDSNENLAYALNFPEHGISKMPRIRKFMEDIYSYTKTDPDWETRHLSPKHDANYYSFNNGIKDPFLEKITLTKDNISVAHLGTVEEDKRGIQSMCGSFGLMRVFLNHLNEGSKDYVLVDLAAGNDLLTRATVMNMDEILLVVEPTFKNLSVAKDILISLKYLSLDRVYVIVNKSFDDKDIELVSKELIIRKDNIRRISFDQKIIELDNAKSLSFDNVPDEAKKAIKEIVESMLKNPIDRNKLIKRASMIDARLFPEEKSKLSEARHI